MTRTRLRVVDAVVVGTIVLVGVAAALDAVVPRAPRGPALAALVRIGADSRARSERRLRAAGVRGTLVVADAGCRLAVLPLPTLTPVRDLGAGGCDAAVSPRSPRPSGWFAWRDPSFLVARCVAGGLEVAAPGGPRVRFVRGCAPAWKPDGTLTYVRRGEVAHFPHAGRARVALARYQLDRAFGARRRPRVRAIAWATEARCAALVELDHADSVVLAFFDDGELVSSRRIDPHASGVAVRSEAREAVVLARASHHAVLYGRGSSRRALGDDVLDASWAPDGGWLAVARSGGIDLLDEDSETRARLPIDARAVAWR
ncbi:MAG: hypothetical protein ICV74_02920 [Thermoleophilia bacterium]|nr:hypothetical protein [Thermoleophilia bacterium]